MSCYSDHNSTPPTKQEESLDDNGLLLPRDSMFRCSMDLPQPDHMPQFHKMFNEFNLTQEKFDDDLEEDAARASTPVPLQPDLNTSRVSDASNESFATTGSLLPVMYLPNHAMLVHTYEATVQHLIRTSLTPGEQTSYIDILQNFFAQSDEIYNSIPEGATDGSIKGPYKLSPSLLELLCHQTLSFCVQNDTDELKKMFARVQKDIDDGKRSKSTINKLFPVTDESEPDDEENSCDESEQSFYLETREEREVRLKQNEQFLKKLGMWLPDEKHVDTSTASSVSLLGDKATYPVDPDDSLDS